MGGETDVPWGVASTPIHFPCMSFCPFKIRASCYGSVLGILSGIFPDLFSSRLTSKSDVIVAYNHGKAAVKPCCCSITADVRRSFVHKAIVTTTRY